MVPISYPILPPPLSERGTRLCEAGWWLTWQRAHRLLYYPRRCQRGARGSARQGGGSPGSVRTVSYTTPAVVREGHAALRGRVVAHLAACAPSPPSGARAPPLPPPYAPACVTPPALVQPANVRPTRVDSRGSLFVRGCSGQRACPHAQLGTPEGSHGPLEHPYGSSTHSHTVRTTRTVCLGMHPPCSATAACRAPCPAAHLRYNSSGIFSRFPTLLSRK
jgi:hypothetical protein